MADRHQTPKLGLKAQDCIVWLQGLSAAWGCTAEKASNVFATTVVDTKLKASDLCREDEIDG